MYTSSVTKKRVWRRVSLGLLSLVLATVSIVLPLSQTTFAEAGVASVASYKDDTIRRSLAEAMTECISSLAYESGNTSTEKSAEDIARGDWGNTQRTPYVGPLADNTDGRLDCNKEVPQKTKDYFGYASYIDMYCDLGGTPAYRSTSCKDAGSGDIMQITGSKSSSVISVLEKKLGKKLPKNNPTLDYALAFGSLTAKGYGCNAELRTSMSADDLKRPDNHKVTVALTDGTTKEVYFYIPQARQNDNIQMFASGFTRWAGKPKLKCSDLVNWTSSNAVAYAKQIKQDVTVEAEGKVRTALIKLCTNGSTGDTVTEYCNTQVNQWLSKCKAQLPTSGAVKDSANFVDCIVDQSGKTDDEVKAALADVSVEQPTEAEGPSSEDTVSCAISGVGWIVCPTVNFLAGVADAAFDFLADNFLSIPASFFDASKSNPTFAAWQTFVSFANAAFVLVFLVMIYSQITGGGWSNYTLKKLLPKLIIAAILVNLSFYICAIAVDLSNIFGYTLKSLLSSVASDSMSIVSSWDKTGSGFSGIAGTVLAGGAAGAVAVGASGGITLALVALLGILISGLVALIMIFLILMIRQVLIVLLVVIAPLAFVAFLLPNMESLFKKWQKLFTSMLLLFPVVGLIYGASSLASNVIVSAYNNNPDDTGELGNIIAAGVMILPLFVVPGVLKKSIDAIGGLGGKISGIGAKLGGGAQKKLANSNFTKFQQQQSAQRKALTQAGKYKGRNIFRRAASGLNSLKNNNSTFNKMTGDYGYRSSAQGQAIFDKEEQEAAARALEYQYGGNAVEALSKSDNQAIKNLAVSTLAGKGDWGAKQISQYLQNGGTISSRSMADTISGMKNTHAGLGEAGTAAIGHFESGKTDGFGVSSDEMAKFSTTGVAKLSDENLAKQSSEAVSLGASAIGSKRATEMLKNDRLRSTMTAETKDVFRKISSGEPGVPAPTPKEAGPSRREQAEAKLKEAAQGTSGSTPFAVSSQGTAANSAGQATGYDKQQAAANGESSGRTFAAGSSGGENTKLNIPRDNMPQD